MANDFSVMTWLINSRNEKVSIGVMFLKSAKEIWDNLKEMYSNQQNISRSRVADLYERLFSL